MTKRCLENLSRLEDYCEGRIELDQFVEEKQKLAHWDVVFKHSLKEAQLVATQLFESESDLKYLFALGDALELDVKPQFKMFGKKCHMQRDVGFFAMPGIAGYSYARQTSASKKMSEPLRRFMLFVNHICGSNFNGVLVNRYNGGSDYISPHSDDENGLEPAVGVVAVSVGAPRTINFESKTDAHDYVMQDGSALCMNGKDFQKIYTHGIKRQKLLPKSPFQSKEERRRDQTRISFTFRCHKKDDPLPSLSFVNL